VGSEGVTVILYDLTSIFSVHCCVLFGSGGVLVSELVSALLFEDVSFLHEQILDTPTG
jgi:hypothetical protein